MQTVITDTGYQRTVSLLKREYDALAREGSFFAMVRTEYDRNGTVCHDFLDVIDAAAAMGYRYVNTIVFPTAVFQQAAFRDNVRYVVWLCKDHGALRFRKDAIREKHIWKDVEWGRRAKNYNPLGKDPGNVWIPTEDDGHAHITKHLLLSEEEIIARLLAMADCGEDYLLVRDEFHPTPCCPETLPAAPFPAPEPAESRVVFGSSEELSAVADGSVKLIVTSPPYWDLKDYFKAGQIGQESYEMYLSRMAAVWQQCYRKLTPDGSLWVNINIRVRGGEVIPLPRDFVRLCREAGFRYKGIVIWHKSSGIPTGSGNIVDRHEYVLLFSRQEDFTVDGSVFAAFGDYKNDDINGGAFWNINRKAGSVGKKYIHPAIYPTELVERIVLCASAPGDTVLDPFLGSGTTLIAALRHERRCIGYEYNEGFRELILSRLPPDFPPIPFVEASR